MDYKMQKVVEFVLYFFSNTTTCRGIKLTEHRLSISAWVCTRKCISTFWLFTGIYKHNNKYF